MPFVLPLRTSNGHPICGNVSRLAIHSSLVCEVDISKRGGRSFRGLCARTGDGALQLLNMLSEDENRSPSETGCTKRLAERKNRVRQTYSSMA